MEEKVTIIGGGVIGLLSAYYLNEKGYKVTVFDSGDFKSGASFGNAGMIVPSHFVPLSSPGALAKGIKWIFNSKSPFYIKPRVDINLISWVYQFMRHANQSHLRKTADILYKLNFESRELYKDLEGQLNEVDLNLKGLLMYCNSKEVLDEELKLLPKAQEFGLDVDVLDNKGINELENIESSAVGAVYFKDDAWLSPSNLMEKLILKLERSGVILKPFSKIEKVVIESNRVKHIEVNGEHHDASHFVLSAGTWTSHLLNSLNVKIHLQGAKGYSFDIPNEDFAPKHCSILNEAKIACTPMGDKVRFAGTLALDGLNNQIDHNRLKGIYENIPKYFPQLKSYMFEDYNTWYGYRPCSPDGLPYLGRTNQYSNLIVATGHGMMGLSMGAISGKLVSQIVSNESIQFNIDQLAVNRFR